MVPSKSSIFAARSCFARSFFSVCNSLVLNSSTQKSLCLISSSFSLVSCATMSSMAFFTRVKASKRTRTANVAKRGFCVFWATAERSLEACVRLSDELSVCKKDGLNVLVKRS